MIPNISFGDEPHSDVIVFGAGCAGLTAACILREKNIERLLVLESEPLLGGSSALCGGQWAVAGTELQKASGVKDSEQLFFKDMLDVGHQENDRPLVRSFVHASLEQYKWILSKGVYPKSLAATAGMSVPRAHIFDPKAVLGALVNCCELNNVPINCGAKVCEITKDNENFFRLLVVHNAEQKILKSKAVILSTGGFSRNREMIRKFAPSMGKVISFSGVGSRGDGLNIALSLGAQTADIGNIKASFGFSLNARGTKQISGVFYAGAIIVNEYGERFVNESLPNKLIGDAAISEGKSFIVFDENIRRKQMELRPNDAVLLEDVGDIGHAVLKGGTLMEVARKAGINGDKLVGTVKDYNERIEFNKKDHLGRDSLSSGWGKCKLIQESPFYIMPAFSGITGTYGGVKIDCQARVINFSGEAIRGLYAAGEVTGGVHGNGFMAGTAFAKAAALGRIAALSAADLVG